jgi:hypothetical protein
MEGRAIFCGWSHCAVHRRLAALVLMGALAAPPAAALPILRFAVPGDAQTLGAGAASPTINQLQEALKLERPAFLTEVSAPEVRVQVDTESTIDLSGKQPYSGTRAGDLRMRATYVQPLKVLGRSVWLAASGRYEDGTFTVQNRKEELFIDIREHRSAFQLAAAWKPWKELRLGASAGFGLGRAFAVEVSHQLGPLEVGFVRRTEQLTFDLLSLPGPPRRIQRPSISYSVLQTRQVGALTGALRTKWLDLLGSYDGLTGQYRLDAAAKPFRWLTLRGYADSATYRFDEWATDDGEPIVRVNMGMSIRRWMAGVDGRYQRHSFSVHHMRVAASTTGAWSDNGTVTARRLLNVDVDFQLYLRHLYRLSTQQWSAGWTRSGEHWDVSAGLQHLRIETATGGAVYGSALTTTISGRDPVLPATAYAFGLTTGVSYRTGKVQLSVSLAQLIPYATDDGESPGDPNPQPTQPAKPAGPGTSTWQRIKQALDMYGGGRVVMAEIRRTF